MKRYTIWDFAREFPDEDSCMEWLRAFRWPDGIRCVRCQRVTSHHRVRKRRSYSCARCGHHVHPTAGTVFAKSTTSLRSWFFAVLLIASTREVPARQLKRLLGVGDKTAWAMREGIRTGLFSWPDPFRVDDGFPAALQRVARPLAVRQRQPTGRGDALLYRGDI